MSSILAATVLSAAVLSQPGYTNTILVASSPVYDPLSRVDVLLSNGWGLAIRPAGAGGHFWVSNSNTGSTTTYVGDVRDPSGRFQPLSQDSLRFVWIGVGAGAYPDGSLYAPIPVVTGQTLGTSCDALRTFADPPLEESAAADWARLENERTFGTVERTLTVAREPC